MVSFNTFFNKKVFTYFFLALLIGTNIWAQEVPPTPKRVPRMQVIPMPYHQASFQRDGVEITRYHFGPGLHRPFLFPIIGQSGISLTRMGHPHDPESHSHHNSVWISHNDVDGISFWSDGGGGLQRFAHKTNKTRPCLARYDLQKLYPGVTAQIFGLW